MTVLAVTTGGVFTVFTLPTPNAQPIYITAGPDGNMWFSESFGIPRRQRRRQDRHRCVPPTNDHHDNDSRPQFDNNCSRPTD